MPRRSLGSGVTSFWLFVGTDMVNDVIQNGRRFYTIGLGQAFMPVEF